MTLNNHSVECISTELELIAHKSVLVVAINIKVEMVAEGNVFFGDQSSVTIIFSYYNKCYF